MALCGQKLLPTSKWQKCVISISLTLSYLQKRLNLGAFTPRDRQQMMHLRKFPSHRGRIINEMKISARSDSLHCLGRGHVPWCQTLWLACKLQIHPFLGFSVNHLWALRFYTCNDYNQIQKGCF